MRSPFPDLLLASLGLSLAVPAAASSGTAIQVLCGYYGELLDASAEEHRMLRDALDETTGTRTESAELEKTRHRLELKRLEAERSLLDLLCDAGPQLTLRQRHRAEALIREARQAHCHAEGKLLARAEASSSSSASRQHIDFYRERVDRCIESGIAAAEVRFPSTDGGVVFAELRGAGPHGVVLAHGGRFTKESWAEQASLLADAGYLVLAFDFRGRGRSHGPEGAPPGEHHDVLGAVRYLRDAQGVETVTVIGASFGGWAAARAVVESEQGEIDRLVLLAHSPIEKPEALVGCKLFVVAENDLRGGGVRRLEEIREQYERSPPPKRLVVLPGSAHAQHLFQTDQAERLMSEIVGFLEAPCPEPS